MENDNTREDAFQTTDQYDWQLAENDDNAANTYSDDVDLRAAEADGYGTEEEYEPLSAESLDRDDDEDDDREDDDDTEDGDWGTVDPLEDTDGLPDPMDPSGPGSAV